MIAVYWFEADRHRCDWETRTACFLLPLLSSPRVKNRLKYIVETYFHENNPLENTCGSRESIEATPRKLEANGVCSRCEIEKCRVVLPASLCVVCVCVPRLHKLYRTQYQYHWVECVCVCVCERGVCVSGFCV
jgi:hypothetical protein